MSGVHKINFKKLAICLGISLGVGLLSGIISMMGMESFKQANTPPLTPPDFIFPIVWTILFILMGISSYIISTSDSPDKTTALAVYGLQLGVNFFLAVAFLQPQCIPVLVHMDNTAVDTDNCDDKAVLEHQ